MKNSPAKIIIEQQTFTGIDFSKNGFNLVPNVPLGTNSKRSSTSQSSERIVVISRRTFPNRVWERDITITSQLFSIQ